MIHVTTAIVIGLCLISWQLENITEALEGPANDLSEQEKSKRKAERKARDIARKEAKQVEAYWKAERVKREKCNAERIKQNAETTPKVERRSAFDFVSWQ
jgi:hypothetical protein